ncbi:MAG: LysR substrate-binding domain-containing protein [Bowdeniella nasicola]|nr:LysR substrate-binding domain-containing protein [Bowdeniella nasicola]
MNLRDFEYLVALHEEGNFSRAAARAGVAQPTLSTQVRKLEAELGVALVERAPAGVIFTAAGREVLARARHVLNDVAEIRTLARRAADPSSATLTVGLFPTLGPYLLPHLVEQVRTKLSGVQLRLVEEKSEVLISRLLEGDLDAITLAEDPAVDGVRSTPLFREEFVLAAPSGHPLTKASAPLHLADLAGHEVLLLDDGHCLRDQTLDLCQRVGARQANFRATSLEALRYMVAAGAGVTLLPRLATRAPVTQPGGLVLREFDAPRPHRDISLVWRRTAPLAPLMDTLAQAMRAAGHSAGLQEPPAS